MYLFTVGSFIKLFSTLEDFIDGQMDGELSSFMVFLQYSIPVAQWVKPW